MLFVGVICQPAASLMLKSELGKFLKMNRCSMETSEDKWMLSLLSTGTVTGHYSEGNDTLWLWWPVSEPMS